MLVSCDLTNNAGSSSLVRQKCFWRSLWQLRVPNKIKHFAWRACLESLPTMTNLQHRCITTLDTCEACQTQPEDTLLALWSCPKLEEVWNSLSWAHQSVNAQTARFQDLLDSFMQFDEDYRKEIFIITAWILWNRRNASRLGLPVQPLNRICPIAGSLLQEFLDAQDLTPATQEPFPTQQWCPLEAHIFKANFDAAVFRSDNLAGLGVVSPLEH